MLPEVLRFAPLIVDTARRYRLVPSLVAGIITLESRGDPNAVSPAGAIGLMQVMPAEYIAGRPIAQELCDPATNIEWGCRILAENRQRWGTQAGALAAYYGAVDDEGRPSEAHDGSGVNGWVYVARVEQAALAYLDLDQYAEAAYRQWAPASSLWREVAANLKGVCDDALVRLRAAVARAKETIAEADGL